MRKVLVLLLVVVGLVASGVSTASAAGPEVVLLAVRQAHGLSPTVGAYAYTLGLRVEGASYAEWWVPGFWSGGTIRRGVGELDEDEYQVTAFGPTPCFTVKARAWRGTAASEVVSVDTCLTQPMQTWPPRLVYYQFSGGGEFVWRDGAGAWHPTELIINADSGLVPLWLRPGIYGRGTNGTVEDIFTVP